MKANIEKTFQVSHPVDQVWDHLSDPNKIVTCVPGASLTEQVDEKNYKGKVSLKFGPVAANYNGQITLDELNEESKTMVITGKGMEARGQGSAGMVLNAILKSLDNGDTEVDYKMEVSVSGKLAQFGSRLIVDVSDTLANQFIQNFKNQLAASAPAAAEDASDYESTVAATVAAASPGPPENSVNVFSLIIAVISNAFKRLFKGSDK